MMRPSRTRTLPAAALAALAALGATGCSFAASEATFVLNHCASDADCPGSTCDVDRGMCVARDTSPLLVALEVAAPGSGAWAGPAVVTSEPFVVAGPTTRTVQMPRAVTAFGLVRTSSGARIPSELTFTAAPAFPGGRPLRFTTVTAAEPFALATLGAPEADYQISLPPGTYDLDVRPAGLAASELPPLRFTGVTIEPADGAALPVLFDAERLATLSGIVLGSDGLGRGGLQVQAIDVASGRVVSSSATTADGTTGTPPGEFTIRFDATATDYVLRIGAMSDALFPTFSVDPRFLYPEPDGYARILVPDVAAPVCYRGSVEATVAGARALAPGTVLAFRSTVIRDEMTGVLGTWETTVAADAAGRFEAQLLPGIYDIVFTPVGNDAIGVLADMVTISAPAPGTDCLMGQVFSLPPRASLGGALRTPDGREMPGATVQAIALNREASSRMFPAARFNRSSEAVTDDAGRFDLRLDVGTYDIVAKASAESGFPWLVLSGQELGAPGVVLARELDLQAPVHLSGQVLDDTGVPVQGAEVGAFGILEEPGGARRSVPIARGTTDADGQYELLLPPRL